MIRFFSVSKLLNPFFLKNWLFAFVLLSAGKVVAQPVANFTVQNPQGCATLVVTFSNTSTGGPFTNVVWNFGNGNSISGNPAQDPTLNNPFITYPTPGQYTVTLTVTSASGTNTITQSQVITVFPRPTAAFSASSLAGCTPFVPTFTDQSQPGTGGPAIQTWTWDFGNGQFGSTANPSQPSYNQPGTYCVSLNVIDGNGCSNEFTQTDCIEVSGPNATFNVTPTTGCNPPLTVNFTNNSTPGGLTYAWDFGNGNTSTAQSPPSQNYTQAQDYTVTLSVTDGQGCQATATRTITLTPYQADFNFPVSGCAPFQAQFSNASNPGTNSWAYNFGDPASGNSNQAFTQSPSHTYNTAGTYTVTLIARNQQGCADTVTHQVIVNPKPVPQTDSLRGCEIPFTANLTDNTTGNITAWSWNVIDADNNTVTSSSQESPSITIGEEGNYSIILSVTDNNGCSGLDTFPDYIKVLLPIANFLTDTPGGCFPIPVNFTDSSSFFPSANTWTWDFGDGTTGTGPNPTHVYQDTGVYPVLLTVTNSLGCTDTTTLEIPVGQKPLASFIWAPDSVCYNTPITFTDQSSPFVDQWDWSFGSTEEDPTTTFPDTGYFPVKLTVAHNLCFDDTLIDSAVYYIPPKAIINLSDNIFCKEEYPVTINPTDDSHARGYTEYHWDFGFPNLTNDTSNLQNPPPITYTYSGIYTLKLIVNNIETGCIDSTTKDITLDHFVMQPNAFVTSGCQPFNASILGSYFDSIPATIQSYLWNFDDGSFPLNTSDLVVNHLYTASGTFNPSVTAINNYGCTDTQSLTLTVSQRPTALISTLDTVLCLPETGLFTDASTTAPGQSIVDNFWITEQNIQGTDPTFSTTYVITGVDTIKHWVTDGAGCQSDTAVFAVRVSKAIAAFLAPAQVCSGDLLQFNSTQSSGSGTGITLDWDFGDGDSLSIPNPSHSYDADSTTTFTVLLTVTNTYGCVDTASQDILVPKPNADFLADLTVSECPPFYANFNNLSSNEVTSINYIWGDGFNTVQTGANIDTVSHVFAFPGIYTVTQIVTTQAGCRDTLIRPDYIFVGGPTASFDFTPKTSECAPVTVTFTASGGQNVSQYFWVFGDGSIDTSGAVVTHTYTNAGDFAPVLIIRDSLNTAQGDTTYCSVTVFGDVLSIRGPQLDFSADTLELCGPYSVSFTNNTTFPTGVTVSSWLWNFGDGNTSTEQNPGPHPYTAAGNYDVTLTAITPSGCTYTITKENYIKFFQGPPLFFPPINESRCPAICVDLEVNITGFPLEITSYTWNLIDTTISNETNVSWCYTKPGLYQPQFEVMFQNGCVFAYDANADINVWNVPEASFDAFPVLVGNKVKAMEFTNTSVGSDSIVWNFGDGSPSETANTVSHTYNDTGTYDVLLVAYSDSGCADTAIFKLNVEESINVPNVFTPNNDGINDVFTFNIPGSAECLSLDVYDRWGKLKFNNENFKNDWGGTDQSGKILNPDTYYYILNFCKRFTITGFVVVMYDNK